MRICGRAPVPKLQHGVPTAAVRHVARQSHSWEGYAPLGNNNWPALSVIAMLLNSTAGQGHRELKQCEGLQAWSGTCGAEPLHWCGCSRPHR